MALLGAWREADRLDQHACLAEALAARGLPPFPVPAVLPPASGHAAAEKMTRDPYDAPNAQETSNFVAYWGTEGSVSGGDVSDLLEAFELAWSHHIGTMGLPEPSGSDLYKFNVYIGDTGSGIPGSYGAGGYYTVDGDGYPMIVIALGSMDDMDWGITTAAHEFFHAVQHAAGAFATETGSWFWEATATWVEAEVYPEIPYYAAFLYGYAFLPHLPLSFFDYPDSGTLQESHQYGAFIFPRYLSEIVADWTLVRDAWIDGYGYSDPLDVLDDALVERGSDLYTTWGDFLARNTVWDYQDQDTYVWYLDYYEDWFEDDDHRIARSWYGAGDEAWFDASEVLPERFGSNTLVLRAPEAGTLRVEFQGDAQGSAGSAATWIARIVVDDSGDYTYGTLPLEGTSGGVDVPVTGGEDAVYLVVGATCAHEEEDEVFGYQARMWIPDEGVDDTADVEDTAVTDDSGCACSTPGTSPRRGRGMALAGLLALAVLRRRGPGR
jgi:MYXO-CTERM domain-containing protein